MTKPIFVLLISTLFPLVGSAQFRSDDWINIIDTTEVLKIVNGEWKIMIQDDKCRYNFTFENNNLKCVDSVNMNNETGKPTSYELSISENGEIYLSDNIYSPYELWIIDKRTMVIDLGPDVGKRIMKKKR